MNMGDQILSQFQIPCNYTHTHCKNIARMIEMNNDKTIFTDHFLHSYLLFLNNTNNGGYYYYDSCWNIKNIHKALHKILSYVIPSNNDLNIIVDMATKTTIGGHYNIYSSTSSHQYCVDFINALIEKNVKFTSDSLLISLKNRNLEIAMTLINHVNPTSECLEEACLLHNSEKLVGLIVSQKIQITTLAIKNAICVNNNDIVKLLMQIGVTPNEECLIEACRLLNVEIIGRILMYKIKPTKRCYEALLSSCNINYGKNKECGNAYLVASIIDLLVEHGYCLTYDDIYEALCKGCFVNNVKKYGIEFDDNFIKICATLSYYPYDDILPTMECLYTECKRPSNKQTIKKMISQGLIPNVECLEHACDNRSNIQNVKYLVESCKIKPNITCLKNLAKHIGNSTLTYLLNNLDPLQQIINNDDKEEDQQDINNVQEHIEELIPNQINSTSVEIINNVEENVEENVDIKSNYDIAILDKCNDEEISNKIEYILDDRVCKLLKMKLKTKMTFLNLRKELLAYITKNKLLDKMHPNLIKPNKGLSKMLCIKSSQYLDFNSINDVTWALLKIEN